MEFETGLGIIFGFLAGVIVVLLLLIFLTGPQVTEMASYMSCEELKSYALSFPSQLFENNIAPVLQLKCGI